MTPSRLIKQLREEQGANYVGGRIRSLGADKNPIIISRYYLIIIRPGKARVCSINTVAIDWSATPSSFIGMSFNKGKKNHVWVRELMKEK